MIRLVSIDLFNASMTDWLNVYIIMHKWINKIRAVCLKQYYLLFALAISYASSISRENLNDREEQPEYTYCSYPPVDTSALYIYRKGPPIIEV